MRSQPVPWEFGSSTRHNTSLLLLLLLFTHPLQQTASLHASIIAFVQSQLHLLLNMSSGSDSFWSNACQNARDRSLQTLLDASRASCGVTVTRARAAAALHAPL